MNMDEFLKQAWKDHAEKTEEVAKNIGEAISLAKEPQDVMGFVRLVQHVFGEHLADSSRGISILASLHEKFANTQDPLLHSTLNRGRVLFEILDGNESGLTDLSLSDKIQVLASTAQIFFNKNNFAETFKRMDAAEFLVTSHLSEKDPAFRAFAVASNNLACSLEEKSERTPDEDKFMVRMATQARKYWELAGGWLEIERAEYRLAMSLFAAKNFEKSLEHAKQCLEICKNNNADALELYFAYEALIRASNELGTERDEYREGFLAAWENLSDDDKSWCKKTYSEIQALAARVGRYHA